MHGELPVAYRRNVSAHKQGQEVFMFISKKMEHCVPLTHPNIDRWFSDCKERIKRGGRGRWWTEWIVQQELDWPALQTPKIKCTPASSSAYSYSMTQSRITSINLVRLPPPPNQCRTDILRLKKDPMTPGMTYLAFAFGFSTGRCMSSQNWSTGESPALRRNV